MNKKMALGIKLVVAFGFILSIVAFFMIFIDLNPLNIEGLLSGVDIIKLPDKIKKYSNNFNIISFIVPNLIASVEGTLIIISRCFIVINIINLLGAILTIVIRKRKGFIVTISAVIINISILAFVSIKINSEINSLKESIGDALDKLMNLIGVNITVTGNIDAAQLIGPGLIIFFTVQLAILILSIIGIILRDQATVKKTT